MREQTDDELVGLVVSGDDRKAFELLIERHKRGIFALLYRLLGKSGEIEDIAQNVFLAAYRGLRTFQGKAKFSTWVYRIAYNQACSALRKLRTRKLYEDPGSRLDDDGRAEVEFAGDAASDPESETFKKQVWQVVGRLPTQSRAVIELFYRQGLRYPEIAETLEMPLGTVKTHLYRARAQLRTLLLRPVVKQPMEKTDGR